MRQIKLPEDKEIWQEHLQERKNLFTGELFKETNKIINEVAEGGDKSLRELTEKFDGVVIDDFRVDTQSLAQNEIAADLLKALKKSKSQLEEFYRQQSKKQSWFSYRGNSFVGEQVTPLTRVGLYIPGGRAAYPSSVLMTAIPAQVAGVKELVAVTPPSSQGINPVTAKALDLCGVEEVYTLGGAQAIAALALGTETIKAVDKIVGPGNKYVTMAKKILYGQVDIDMLAGPSEVLIIADKNARPDFIAADLLAQAEHDPEARAVVVSPEPEILAETKQELEVQLKNLTTAATARQALKDYGLLLEVKDLNEAIAITNQYAPEHLEILTEEPLARAARIKNAGSIFLGNWTPEVLGDYLAGPNHVLPTAATARFSSGLGTEDFLKSSGLIYYDQQELAVDAREASLIAKAEGLPAHARAALIRLDSELAEGEKSR